MAQTSRSNPAIGGTVPTQYSNGNGRSNGNGNGGQQSAAEVADDQPF